MTEPDGTVVLEAVDTLPTTSPAFVIAVVAAACVTPTTLGTATFGGPDDTTIATALPLAARAKAAGVWLSTMPDGTVVLDAVVTSPTMNPASVNVVVAVV